MHSPPKRVGWKAGTIAVAALGGLVRLSGCNHDGTSADMGTNPDMAVVTPGVPPTSATSVTNIDRPLAAVVSPDGQTVYLTAHENGLAQLFSVPVAGGAPTKIATTSPLYHPLGMAISPDGQTLYFADSIGGKIAGNEDAGAVYSSSLSGAISGGTYDGIRGPAGVAVSADGNNLYVTGFDKTDGKPGVFVVAASGGSASVFAKGAPFNNPSAVTVAADGAVYVVDATAQGTGLASVIKIQDGIASAFNTGTLKVGFGAGIAPVGPGSTDLLVTGNTGLGSGVVYQLTTPGGVATPLTLGSTVFFDPATIARAKNANVWIVVDTVIPSQPTPGQQQGAIYKLSPTG